MNPPVAWLEKEVTAMHQPSSHRARGIFAPKGMGGSRPGRVTLALILAFVLAVAEPAAVLAAGGSASRTAKTSRNPSTAAAVPVSALVKDKSPKTAAVTASRSTGLSEADWAAAAEPDELVVRLVPGAGKARRDALGARIASAGGRLAKTSKDGGAVLVRVPAGKSRQAFAKSLFRNANVAAVQPNYRYQADWVPNDTLYAQQWGLPRIGCEDAWNVTTGSADVVVAVIDTGVDMSHPDLAGQIDTVHDHDFVNDDDNAQDDEGHGTHVSGTIAALTDNDLLVAGVAPNATILPIKVLDWRGSGSTFGVAQGIRWAADNGADVINMSLGGGSYDSYMADQIAYAQNTRDVVVVAAAGNEGSSAGANYPARYPGVLGVAATTNTNAHASFSNYGTGIDIAAPGVDILSTTLGGGTDSYSGTSMASPHVAGVAALVRANSPGLDQSQVIQQLTATAQDLGAAGPDIYFGAGLVRADSALGGGAVPPAGDDNIPGVPLTPSPVNGSLTAGTDVDDVFKIYLNAGEQLDVAMTADAGTDFDLYLFGPSATDVNTSPWETSSTAVTYPEQISYTAGAAGYYYVDVYLYPGSGSGAYSFTWSMTNPGAPDDNIPGVALPASPVGDSLARGSDNDDVFKIDLTAGERVTFSLTADASTDFDLYLFDPTATDVNLSGGLVAYSNGVTYPEPVVYTATTSGDHYIDVYSYSGTGSYTLTWTKDAGGSADDNIPGVPITASPVNGSLTAGTDVDDVYRVYLAAGQTVDVTLTADAGTNFDLYLFGPSATDVNTSPWETSSTAVTYPERISYTAGAAGYHYVDVYLYPGSGSGAYALTWSTSAAGSADDNIPGVDAPDIIPIPGSLTAGSDIDDVYRIYATAGQQITLSLTGAVGTDFDLYLFGPSATDVNTSPYLVRSILPTYPEQISYTVATTGYHYIDVYDWSGTGEYVLWWDVQTPSPPPPPPPPAPTPEPAPVTPALPGHTLYTPVAPSTVYYGRTFTMYGFLKPRHAAGAYSVKLEGYRYERQSNGTYKWVRRATWYARNYNYSTYTKYIKAGNLRLRGKWRVRAVHTHTGYLPKYSGYRYLTVR